MMMGMRMFNLRTGQGVRGHSQYSLNGTAGDSVWLHPADSDEYGAQAKLPENSGALRGLK